MFWLICQAYLCLIRFDCYLARGNFAALHQAVKRVVPSVSLGSQRTCEVVCRAVDLACVFYCKEVLCLQRSAATTVLLRKFGIRAELVIGVQQLPFKAHAWLEVSGRVVNEKPSAIELYAVLERC
jgi:hypothetical protein